MAKTEPITGLNSQAPTHENARIIAQAKINELYNWQEWVDQPYALRELHNMRIAAKRVRYTLEIFEDVLPAACQNARKEMEQLQEELGQLHDSDVMIALLRLCLASQEKINDGKEQKKQAKSLLPPDLIPILLDPKAAPDAEQRTGLEQLLTKSLQEREKHYQEFHQHWQHLQEQDFRQHLLAILGL